MEDIANRYVEFIDERSVRAAAHGLTTNAIESMHMQLRKIVKNRGHFPSVVERKVATIVRVK